ncbi:MAG: murein hydrolase activator EnvC family protein [Gaiellaceae bacterium]|jgi:murein DD-endopeptidase MepM/ murein hydrolase activator NlpD
MGRVLRRAGCALFVALVLAPAASAHVGGDYSLRFEWPADGILSSPFGPRDGGFHPGIDIGTLRDLTVRAATPGRVVAVGAIAGYDGYGNVVVLNLGGGLTSLYAHLARPFARVGQFIAAGQVIGEAGCTGWCTGTHLHFELRYRGTPIDPVGLFDAPLG